MEQHLRSIKSIERCETFALCGQIILCFAGARERNLVRRACANCHSSEKRGALWRANKAWSRQFLSIRSQAASAWAKNTSSLCAFCSASLNTHSSELQDSLRILSGQTTIVFGGKHYELEKSGRRNLSGFVARIRFHIFHGGRTETNPAGETKIPKDLLWNLGLCHGPIWPN